MLSNFRHYCSSNLLGKGLAAALFAALALVACHSKTEETPDPNANWDAQVRLSKAQNTSTEANVVEVNLEAVEADIELKPGVKTHMWTYSGVFPGPTIEAKRGDTVIVNFTNKLPQETTVHWHGVEVPASMDGSHLSQHPVQPGETFRYEFKVTTASTFWYHPHVHTDEQVERGLYGALIVRDEEEDQRLALPTKELVLVLDDILLDEAGQIKPFSPTDPVERATLALNGREGNFFMVNGRNFPNIDLTTGEPVRVRLINAANSRFFRLSFPNVAAHRIGGDGGLIGKPAVIETINKVNLDTLPPVVCTTPPHCHTSTGTVSDPSPAKGLMLVPGERADIVLIPTAVTGTLSAIEWHDFPRGRHSVSKDSTTGMLTLVHGAAGDGAASSFNLARLTIAPPPEAQSSETLAADYEPPATLRDVPTLTVTSDTPKLRIDLGHDAPADNGDVSMYAYIDGNGQGIPYAQLADTQALKAKVGQTYILEVTNHTMHDHPFHPHGFSFQLLETEYVDEDTPSNNSLVKATFVENKDSLRVPSRKGAIEGRSKTIMRLAIKFDDTGREGKAFGSGKMPTMVDGMHQPGGWLIHCHILEHEVGGMATYLNLVP